MVRPLSERPPIPSPALAHLADTIEAEARRLAAISRPAEDVDLHRLWRRLAIWATIVRRLANSGPASHDVALRMFEEHPDHDRAGEDAIVEFEALGDVIAFLTTGDLVLGSIATLFLGRWVREFDDTNPWPAFAAAIDELPNDDPDASLIAPTRRLDLGLREARHRIVAHRRGIHGEILSWDGDDAVRIELVNVDLYDARADVPRQVTSMLRSVERRLATAVGAGGRRLTALPQDDGPDAWPPERIGASFGSLHNHADHLDREARRLVANAHRMAGYETLAPYRVAEDVLRLTAAINDAAPPGSSDGA